MAETLATPEGSAERSPHGTGAGSAPLCWQGQLRTVVVWSLEADVHPCGRGAGAFVVGRQLGPALLLLSSQLLHCPRL